MYIDSQINQYIKKNNDFFQVQAIFSYSKITFFDQ